MRSFALPRFWHRYEALPEETKAQARRAFALFCADPSHPGLRFKPLRGYEGYWSVRITLAYRAICRREGDAVFWFWIGSHADFDRDFG
ncbi:MAG: hypothetical protein HY744_18785 [Deltaproteobacteria bacterium]|nr:hypothetical protein [Deltaproteobacteria bacterium]